MSKDLCGTHRVDLERHKGETNGTSNKQTKIRIRFRSYRS
jgi:hypothetical protein